MAKSDLYSNSLLPLALVAGILSGSLWRSTPGSDGSKSGDAVSGADRADAASPPGPWVSDLRPAMDAIAAALGVSPENPEREGMAYEGGIRLAKAGPARDGQVLDAMKTLRADFDSNLEPKGTTCTGSTKTRDKAARILGASFLADDGGGSKTRAAAANTLLNEYRDWRLLVNLATAVKNSHAEKARPRYDLNFIVATIPDYVDSNSGWLADPGLAAVQSGITSRGYVFDRVKLIDWSRSAGTATASASRLHERQPGALIFRRLDNDVVHLQVVLLVLETPTAGVHQAALRNSLSFLRAWSGCEGGATRPLRVLGPSFSGSIVSLATVLGEEANKEGFVSRLVITGSANADDNVAQMAHFSDGAIYRATVQPTSVLIERMAYFLESMNGAWKDGEHMAVLTESNTAYGNSSSRSQTSLMRYLPHATVFRFPLHVAQLRSDAPAFAQAGGGLLPTAAIPLNMREPAPPTDLVPALRPQLTSPVVEATVDSILDAIRHEKRRAVGIFATDDRDALFLAREVKRSSPDVQLFLFGTHALFLHADYIAYLRGALVASSYSLSLANQPEIGERPLASQREPFSSMSAEGVFYAAQSLLWEDVHGGGDQPDLVPRLAPYCNSPSQRSCVPVAPVSINVIGEDGYWTMPANSRRAEAALAAGAGDGLTPVPPPPDLNPFPLPPLPGRILIGASLIGVVVLAHLIVLPLIRHERATKSGKRPFLELPFVRVLAAPRAIETAAASHRFVFKICVVLLAIVAGWTAAIVLPFSLPSGGLRRLVPELSVLTFILVLVAGFSQYGPARPLAVDPSDASDSAPKAGNEPSSSIQNAKVRVCTVVAWGLFLGILGTMLLLGIVTWHLLRDGIGGDTDSVVFARLVGGGILSPVALTVSIVAALYTAVFTGLRRLSLVGYGYQALSRGSRAFALLTAPAGSEHEKPTETPFLAALLDMPAQNLPAIYPLGVVLALAAAWVGVSHVTTIDGPAFSWFVKIGSLTALGLGLLLLTQGLATWNTARAHLKRLARSPIKSHFKAIASEVPWDISLAPPRLTDLMPVARMADSVMHEFLAFGPEAQSPYIQDGKDIRRKRDDYMDDKAYVGARLGLRRGDAEDREFAPLFARPSNVEILRLEASIQEYAALSQCSSWFKLWLLSDALVYLLEKTHWLRAKTAAATVDAAEPETVPVGAPVRPQARTSREPAAHATATAEAPDASGSGKGGDDASDARQRAMPDAAEREGWFSRCERLVAFQMAFVLRDIVARTITCLFAAMLCLTFLTASHLLYSFNGRASLLTVDLFAVGGAALAAVWILVEMERDDVLSRLRATTPGRIDINWDFMKRIAVYGVLPLLAVITALFPEVGGTLFGWLEPLRRLSSF